MSGIQERFARSILKIKGVKDYLLVRDDGQILANNSSLEITEDLAQIIVLNGTECASTNEALGLRGINHFTMTDHKTWTLFVFPVKNYFLAILRKATETDDSFIKEIQKFIKNYPAVKCVSCKKRRMNYKYLGIN